MRERIEGWFLRRMAPEMERLQDRLDAHVATDVPIPLDIYLQMVWLKVRLTLLRIPSPPLPRKVQ